MVSFSMLAALFGEAKKCPSIGRGREQTLASVSQSFLKIRLTSGVFIRLFSWPLSKASDSYLPRIGWAVYILISTLVASYHQESVGTLT